jgi:hypothetical protein
MQRILQIILIVTFLSVSVQAKRLNPESYYQELWCNEQKGQAEYELEDLTRVDCLLKDKAVEFDFANKWAECIGQSLYYGIKTNKTPVCALIMEKESDIRYLKRIEKLKEKLQLEVIEIYPKEE